MLLCRVHILDIFHRTDKSALFVPNRHITDKIGMPVFLCPDIHAVPFSLLERGDDHPDHLLHLGRMAVVHLTVKRLQRAFERLRSLPAVEIAVDIVRVDE